MCAWTCGSRVSCSIGRKDGEWLRRPTFTSAPQVISPPPSLGEGWRTLPKLLEVLLQYPSWSYAYWMLSSRALKWTSSCRLAGPLPQQNAYINCNSISIQNFWYSLNNCFIQSLFQGWTIIWNFASIFGSRESPKACNSNGTIILANGQSWKAPEAVAEAARL